MKYTKNSQYWLLAGPPLVIIGQGLMIYLVDGAHGTEVTFIVSKVISGIGRALWQTAGQVSVQAVVPRQDVAVVTGLFQAANSVGGAIGTRYDYLFSMYTESFSDCVVSPAPSGAIPSPENLRPTSPTTRRTQPSTFFNHCPLLKAMNLEPRLA